MLNIQKQNDSSFFFGKLTTYLRIFFFFISLFSFIMTSQAKAIVQNELINIKLNNITIIEAVKAIEKQTNYKFVYNNNDVDVSQIINLNVVDESIEKVARAIFAGYNISVRGNNVIVTRKVSSGSNMNMMQQPKRRNVVGQVVDAQTHETIIGANIRVEGTDRGTVTDIDGNFSISVSGSSDVLLITYIGYQDLRIEVDNRTDLAQIELHPDTQALEEVVITAFGTGQKRETMVGSIQTVNPGELRVPSANLSTSFAGRLAGVISYQRTGQPGADGASFYIRGISTISGATSPLIVLDGVEISAGDLNALDPEIIDGFSILKDATATAMYGSRGANGVMIITTKTGSDLSKPIINYRIEGNVAMPTSKIKLADGVTYMKLFNEAVGNLGTSLLYSQDKIYGTENNLNPYVYPNVNWYDEIFKDAAFNQKFNFNIRGGGSKADYFSSISLTHENGILQNRSKDFYSFDNNIDLMRYNLQNNVNAYLSKSSKFSLRLNVNLMDRKGPNTSVSNLYNNIMYINPVDFPIMYPDDPLVHYARWGGYAFGNEGARNPLADFVSGYQNQFESTVVANLRFDQGLDFIVKGLSFATLVSFKNWSSTSTYRSAPYNMFRVSNYTRHPDNTVDYELARQVEEVTPVLGTNGGTSGSRLFYLQANLNWARSFGKHDLNALFIYNQDQFNLNNISADKSLQRLYNSLPQRTQSVAGRLSYAYDNKYLLEFNFGYNGSENFSEGNRFGFFPSVAGGYNISSESWFEPLLPVVSHLKLRGSWGLVGNDRIGGERFVYMSDVSLTGKGFTTGIDMNYSKSGPVYNRYPNYDLTWETGEKINLGLDLHLFDDFRISADFFREERSNIFQQRATIPNYLGTANTAVYANTAAVRNKGFDFLVDYSKQVNRDFIIQMKGTFTFARNEITKYDEPIDQDYPNLVNVGSSLNTHLGYVAEGLFIDEGEIANRPEQQISGNVGVGDIKYKDIPNRFGETDGLITNNDRIRMGYPTVPEIIYGFGPSIRYKKCDFGFLFQGAARTSMMLSNMHPFGTNTRKNVMKWIVDSHWSPNNQDLHADYPRLTQTTHGNNTEASSFWLRDASFLKLKNAEIGYNLKNMRFYLSGTNLLTFSKFKLWDPEQGGGSGLQYPTTRVFNIGFQMTIN
ncbi:TonB-dependent receptor [Proteiniphilum sp. UBA5346]|jgi:TonB-linked SusC/RagA family outer membrane protein|uniref:TonB-dependent receptor n=4 Tax=Proteiniphilum TaxID=294702 RepID=UPI002579D4F3|nr:TonB-dependent receptor [Proteiniphilum sp. UBA5346]